MHRFEIALMNSVRNSPLMPIALLVRMSFRIGFLVADIHRGIGAAQLRVWFRPSISSTFLSSDVYWNIENGSLLLLGVGYGRFVQDKDE